LELARCYHALANNEEADRATPIGSTGEAEHRRADFIT
jgi:hypothetical protein